MTNTIAHLAKKVHIKHGANLAECTVVKAGQGLFLPKHTRVQWVWPGKCKYVPICLPAFSPTNCGREESFGGPAAKTEESMDRLRELHAASGVGGSSAAASYAGIAVSAAVGAFLGLAAFRAIMR